MLSDNRRNHAKRMWSDFCMNPRGELWKKDESNFGNKLMKKMGWKKGDGLGKKGSGITEPIRLTQTHDNEGLGFQKQTSDYSWNWLSHGDDYNSLLNKLQEEHTTLPDGKRSSTSDAQQSCDLEKKSKKSLKRVHYKRVIEGKNLSKRSQSDWKCILGIKRKRKCTENSDLNSEPAVDDGHVRLHTSAMSSQDYFMFKRLKMDKGKQINDTNSSLPVESENVETDQEVAASNYVKRKKNKKKRRKKKMKQERKLQAELEDAESGCSDSAIGSEVSSSCNGDSSEIAPSDCTPNASEVDSTETQNVLDRKGPESDEPLTRTRDEKENLCQAEDSLLLSRKLKKRKKRKRHKSKPISDMTNLEQMNTCQENDSNPICPNMAQRITGSGADLGKNRGILKSRLEPGSVKQQKKSVRFLNKAKVGYVPAKDSVRGGAWFWKRKNLLASLVV